MVLTTEDDVLAFWKKNKIYDKSVKQNSKGTPYFFMDGPPYATGHIHMGTALNKTLKDIALRSRRLQGFNVFDRAGYDTHGVPIELQVEKEIGSRSKKDIEAYGVKKFIDKCKHYATEHVGFMNEEFANLGVWMNFDKPYMTLDDDYIESVWYSLKKAYDKNMLYLGKYPLHVCPRCATAVAFNEIEYTKQQDKAIYVKFPLVDKKGTYLVIWTTTPWTLPANTGVMVHPDFEYAEVKVGKDTLIIAKDRVEACSKLWDMPLKASKIIKGKELAGLKYENPLSSHLKMNVTKAYEVILAPRYVTAEDGTGLVHCAPGHGKEDFDVGSEYGLDAPSPVGIDGILTEEAGEYAGKKARVVDVDIIADLKKDGYLVHEGSYSHDYPVCWRCKTPLLMMSRPQWFLRVSAIKEKLLEESEKVNWIPGWTKLRMKAWLEGISDWPISRERYWGTPLPIWKCDACEKTHVFGNRDDLKKLAKIKTVPMHKPEIDEIEFSCSCGGTFSRVSSVLDVWFDSGVSSWAVLGYPQESKAFKQFWPADLNIEGTDQFRGWWNSQLILSYLTFDEKPFDAIMVHGLVLDISKRKMSKSLGNAVAPNDVIAKFGRDKLRYYLAKFSRGEDFAYNEREFADIQKTFMILSNVSKFISQLHPEKAKLQLEDSWILSRYNSMIKAVQADYTNYKFHSAIERMEQFLVQDLSRTYIQLVRDRADETHALLVELFSGLLSLLAPIAPFVTEQLWSELYEQKEVKVESVHLSSFPVAKDKLIQSDLEGMFSVMRSLVERGLAERDKIKMGLRWPLGKATITTSKLLSEEIYDIIKRQLNVKEIITENGDEAKVTFDLTMTPELEAEGFAREIARRVQAARKEKGMSKDDRISLTLSCSNELTEKLESQRNFILERTGAVSVEFVDEKKLEFELEIKSELINFAFKKTKSH